MATPSGLIKKLSEVMGEIKHVPKRGHNDFHNYDYATESDIVDAVRDGLASRHVMILPRITKMEIVAGPPNSKGVPQNLTFPYMTFALEDGDTGEVRECPWIGCGQDGGDKGIYKGTTGAEKYFLLKLFLIATGDDPEREKSEQPEDKRKRQAPPAQKTSAPRQQQSSTAPAPSSAAVAPPADGFVPTYINPDEAAQLVIAIEASGLPIEEAKAVVKRVAGCDSLKAVPVTKLQALLKAFASVGMPESPAADPDSDDAEREPAPPPAEKRKQASGPLPPCPKCNKATFVIRSKEEYGGGYSCWPKHPKGTAKATGCGNKWGGGAAADYANEPGAAEAAELFR